MVKKTAIIILIIIVLVTGYISFRKLNYWDRSVMIFKYDSSAQFFRGRGGRGFGEFEGRMGVERRPDFREGMPRPGGMNIPDSLMRRTEGRRERNFNRPRPGTDSLATRRIARGRDFPVRGDFGGGGRVRGGLNRRGNSVNLSMVWNYLAVFALFTLIMIYLEKGYRLIFKHKKLTQENRDLII
jgi:hypothetical protein